MDVQKFLVVGSTGHQQVQCVRWDDISSLNLVDFDTIVINVRSLSDKTILALGSDTFEKIRSALSRLLKSEGDIIVIADKFRRVEMNKYVWESNYAWSPINIVFSQEKGDTVERVQSHFVLYLNKLKKWSCYYTFTAISEEFMEVIGVTKNNTSVRFRSHEIIFAKNRYDKMLAGMVLLIIENPQALPQVQQTGRFSILPLIEEIDERAAVNLVLEDLSIPQVTALPEWVENVRMPFVENIQNEIGDRLKQIEELNNEIITLQSKKADIERFKLLLYGDGHELEEIFSECISELGAKVEPQKYSNEEFIFIYETEPYLVECKGVSKSMSLDHVRQIFDYMTAFEQHENKQGKGILLSNAWKNLPIDQRNQGNRQTFPSNVVARARQLNVALISSVDFFHAFCRFLSGEMSGDEILDKITSTVGVVDFDEVENEKQSQQGKGS